MFAFPQGTDSVNYKDKKFDGILYPELSEGKLVAELHSSKQLGFETTRYVERQLNKALENKLLLEKGIDVARGASLLIRKTAGFSQSGCCA